MSFLVTFFEKKVTKETSHKVGLVGTSLEIMNIVIDNLLNF